MQNYNSKSKIIPTIWLLILIFAVSVFIFRPANNYTAGELDNFAQCLAERDFVMYGAYWCPHCQAEKKAFGSSWKYVSSVECTSEPKRCTQAGITSFPTWLGPDGIRLEGEQGVRRLSEVSGCTLD